MKKRMNLLFLILFSLFLVACTQPTNNAQPPGEDPGDNTNHETNQEQVVLENSAFKIFAPLPEADISEDFIVRGLASVFEGTVNFEFEDGHFIMDEGTVTASEAAPEWGAFEFTISIEDAETGYASVVLSAVSSEDGERIDELIIPLNIKKEIPN